jgi:hypothetical protein
VLLQLEDFSRIMGTQKLMRNMVGTRHGENCLDVIVLELVSNPAINQFALVGKLTLTFTVAS